MLPYLSYEAPAVGALPGVASRLATESIAAVHAGHVFAATRLRRIAA
jgi:hypothetical protein